MRWGSWKRAMTVLTAGAMTLAGASCSASLNRPHTTAASPSPRHSIFAAQSPPTTRFGGSIHLPPAPFAYQVTDSSAVALTFDDGPDPRWTPMVLDVLREYHVHAIFCMVGFRVRAHPELVRQVVADGHTLCNHTVDHDPNIGRLPVAAIVRNVTENSALIERASGGVRPRYFRAPRGNFTPLLVHVAEQLGMASLSWHVTSSDWQTPLMTPAAIANWIGRTMYPGCIILFHDGGSPGTHFHTVAGLRLVLDEIEQRRWTVTAL